MDKAFALPRDEQPAAIRAALRTLAEEKARVGVKDTDDGD